MISLPVSYSWVDKWMGGWTAGASVPQKETLKGIVFISAYWHFGLKLSDSVFGFIIIKTFYVLKLVLAIYILFLN